MYHGLFYYMTIPLIQHYSLSLQTLMVTKELALIKRFL